MTINEFWDHIRATRRVDPEAHVQRLNKRLSKLSQEQILDFDRLWDEMKEQAHFWNMWGAAYLINGGCSDDGFTDFRSWLILQGKVVFENAVKNPDSLADVLDGDEADCECYPAMHAWVTATGGNPDDPDYDPFLAALNARHPKKLKRRAMGRQWDFDSDTQVRKRLPRLAAIYLEDDGDVDD